MSKKYFRRKNKIKEKIMNVEQIINGEKLRFARYSNWIPFRFIWDENDNYIEDINIIPKGDIKDIYLNISIVK
jgi:hypothetical protein